MPVSFSSSYTQNFPNLLNHLGVSVLISTYQAGQLIMVRARGGEINTHFTGMEKPMGIALSGGRLTVGGSHQIVEYYNMADVGAKVEPPNTHDACYVPRNLHMTGDIDIHEMEYAGDELWMVNTKMSCLCTLDPAYSIVPRWRPPFISAYDLSDRCHLNGLALRKNRPAFVTMLGNTDTPGGWRINKASGGIMMDVATRRVIAKGLSMPHSPRWYRDQLWFLESGKGTLSSMHPVTGKTEIIAELPGFTRGISFIGQYAFIGLSQVRESAVFAGLPLTERVSERQCGLWVVDIEQRQIIGYLVFTGDVREIFAVSLLPARFPALLDLGDPLVRTTYALPDEALKDVAPPDPLQLLQEQAMRAYQQKEFDEAVRIYREILQQQPDLEQARFHLGVVLVESERWQEAERELRCVVKNNPRHAEAWNSMGLCQWGMRNLEAALNAFDQAVKADQKFARAQHNRSMVLLKQGDYRQGWEAFEWRWQLPEYPPFECPQPLWDGGDIADKTLLVHAEQGSGDAIQFARYLPEVARRCKKLIFVCIEPLRTLFSTIEGVDEVRLPGVLNREDFDVYCPIMTLGRLLDINLDNIPGHFPYLQVPGWVNVPPLQGDGKLKVGICWRGNPTHNNDSHRSTSIDVFGALQQTGMDVFSLQTPLSPEEKQVLEKNSITSLELELIDYSRTAAFIDQLDLVISVDTSVAHLAGALDMPVWLLVSEEADWRWGLEGETTPWYRSARLFRQQALDDWSACIDQVNEELKQLLELDAA